MLFYITMLYLGHTLAINFREDTNVNIDTVLKIILSSTLIYMINFVFKTFTSNNFDKLFIPKHQKILQKICFFIFAFIIFIVYGFFMGALYGQLKGEYNVDLLSAFIVLIYVLGVITIGLLSLRKWRKEKTRKQFNMNEKKANILFYPVMILNIVVYSMMIYELYLPDINNSLEHWGDMVNSVIMFFGISILLLKFYMYLIGFKKRRWSYVLSPRPDDIEKKHLNVLYSLAPNQLVLSEATEDSQNLGSIYLYDMNKNTYFHFERVLSLPK